MTSQSFHDVTTISIGEPISRDGDTWRMLHITHVQHGFADDERYEEVTATHQIALHCKNRNDPIKIVVAP